MGQWVKTNALYQDISANLFVIVTCFRSKCIVGMKSIPKIWTNYGMLFWYDRMGCIYCLFPLNLYPGIMHVQSEIHILFVWYDRISLKEVVFSIVAEASCDKQGTYGTNGGEKWRNYTWKRYLVWRKHSLQRTYLKACWRKIGNGWC